MLKFIETLSYIRDLFLVFYVNIFFLLIKGKVIQIGKLYKFFW
jgi:hypothetical protein